MTDKHGYGHPFNYADKPVAKYVNIFVDMAKDLPKGMVVTDLFGGVGALAKAMWETLEPSKWTSVEIDPACVRAYKESRAVVLCYSAFDCRFFGDLVIIDPHKGTLNSMAKDPQWIVLLRRIARSNAKYILMQEYGAYWCHLPNQKKLYWDLFGYYVDKTNYRLTFADYMFKTYGFVTQDHRIALGSCYYLMENKK